MKVDQIEHTITIKDTQGDFDSFLTKVNSQYKSFENHNIIIDLLSYKEEIAVSNLKLFLPLSKQHKKSKKSFVIEILLLENSLGSKYKILSR